MLTVVRSSTTAQLFVTLCFWVASAQDLTYRSSTILKSLLPWSLELVASGQDEPGVHRFVHEPNSPSQLGGDVKVCKLTFIPAFPLGLPINLA